MQAGIYCKKWKQRHRHVPVWVSKRLVDQASAIKSGRTLEESAENSETEFAKTDVDNGKVSIVLKRDFDNVSRNHEKLGGTQEVNCDGLNTILSSVFAEFGARVRKRLYIPVPLYDIVQRVVVDNFAKVEVDK